MDDVIASIDAQQLEAEFPLLANLQGESFSYLDLAEAIFCDDDAVGSAADALGFGADADGTGGRKRLWDAFTAEFFVMLCTRTSRYAGLRQQVKALKGQSATVIVGTISSAVGADLGVEVGVLTPFVVLLLHGVVSLGLNTMCADYRGRQVSKK